MKKKIWIPIAGVVVLLAILFVPIPQGSYDDGGTREWVALTYKIVDWHKLYDVGDDGPGVYDEVRFYGFADRNKSIDELWERESARFGKRHLEYTDEWMGKNDSTRMDRDNIIRDIIITEIYSNCFFAQNVVPMPYQIKVNGALPADWCVGDQVSITYENTYYDSETHKIEVDMLTVSESDFEIDPNADYKPVIYLYPKEESEINVTLDYNGTLTSTYPAYNNGWTVTASPDGTLLDANGREYYCLFWEGESDVRYDFTEGFCVKGEDTATFLEDALAKLGLSEREANEFIIFWLPQMENNAYNLISFQSDVYTDNAKLTVTPTPDTVIRVFMAWQALDEEKAIKPQNLTAPERDGFTVIEWGGAKVN